ncbi:MAG TPA: hypothetical protein VEI97_00270, partial [bacterium]|nr:hypothetical protein [bacterium]
DWARLFVELGVRECQGKNRSPVIDTLNRFVGLQPGAPYCAAGLSFCFHKALGQVADAPRGGRFPYSGSSQSILRAFRDADRWSDNPQDLMGWAGALGGWTNPTDPAHGHIFLVAGRLTNPAGRVIALATLEFNTSPTTGGRDGQGVFALRRQVPVDRGHRLWFLDTSAIVGGSWWE